jgi:PTS system trehalose-specific IIC component
MTGSALAGMFSVLTGCMSSSIGVGGLPGILSIKPQFWGFYAIAMLIAVGVPFILTTVLGKARGIDKEAAALAAEAAAAEEAEDMPEAELETVSGPVEMGAFLSGKTVDIHEVPDQVFASGALGEGIAIEPTDNVLVAPADAIITTTMPGSNHAVGMRIANGAEILLHIGLDTVSMNGDGFTCHVKEGQLVRKGEKLISFSRQKIKAAGHPLVTMMVVTEDNGNEKLAFENGIDVTAGETKIATIG